MDLLTPVQTCLLTVLLDVLIGMVRARRRRLREPPELRLEAGGAPGRGRRARHVRGVVAVLVSRPAMQARVRDALGELANVLLFFTSSWAELGRVMARVSPSVIIADPLADRSGGPERHLIELSVAWAPPVILYTRLTPGLGDTLLRLGHRGFRTIMVHPFDDRPEQLAAALAAARGDGPEPPLRAA